MHRNFQNQINKTAMSYSNLQLCITRKNTTVNPATVTPLYLYGLPINHDKPPDALTIVLIISSDNI